MTDYHDLDRNGRLRAIARVKFAAARAEPVLARRCGAVCGELGIGPLDALGLMSEVLADLPEVLYLRSAALRLVLAFRGHVDFSILELSPFAAAAVQLFMDEVKAGSAPRAAGA